MDRDKGDKMSVKKLGEVTVGIPFYKKTSPEQLMLAVNSILSQTLPPTRIHLIQDGQIPEALEAIVRCYLQDHPQLFEHLRIPHQGGLSHALNVSIMACRTEFYARMDSDDVALPERLEFQVEYMTDHPEVDIVGGWAWEFSGDQPAQGYLKKLPEDHEQLASLLHYLNPLVHPTVMFRHRVFAKVGLYDTTFRLEEDLELWSRAFRRGARFANVPHPVIYYRTNGVISRRSSWDAIMCVIRVRMKTHTWSPRLNLLKIASIGFKLLPNTMKAWGYKHLRG